MYSHALVYGAFPIAPDFLAEEIKSERGCRKMQASGLGFGQGGMRAGEGRKGGAVGRVFIVMPGYMQGHLVRSWRLAEAFWILPAIWGGKHHC